MLEKWPRNKYRRSPFFTCTLEFGFVSDQWVTLDAVIKYISFTQLTAFVYSLCHSSASSDSGLRQTWDDCVTTPALCILQVTGQYAVYSSITPHHSYVISVCGFFCRVVAKCFNLSWQVARCRKLLLIIKVDLTLFLDVLSCSHPIGKCVIFANDVV